MLNTFWVRLEGSSYTNGLGEVAVLNVAKRSVQVRAHANVPREWGPHSRTSFQGGRPRPYVGRISYADNGPQPKATDLCREGGLFPRQRVGLQTRQGTETVPHAIIVGPRPLAT